MGERVKKRSRTLRQSPTYSVGMSTLPPSYLVDKRTLEVRVSVALRTYSCFDIAVLDTLRSPNLASQRCEEESGENRPVSERFCLRSVNSTTVKTVGLQNPSPRYEKLNIA